MNPPTTTQPHQSLGKFILYVIVAIIFFVGGYYIGKGNMLAAQSASIYRTTTMSPCDFSPTNPCPGAMAVQNATSTCPDGTCGKPPMAVNQHCPAGTQFMNGKCVPSDAAALASINTQAGAGASVSIWNTVCKSFWAGWGLTPTQQNDKCKSLTTASTATKAN